MPPRQRAPLFPRKVSSLVVALAAASSVLGAGQARAGLFDDDEARRQLADFKARTEARFDQQSKGQLDLASQIQRQADENARLHGQIETLTYELETTKKRQQDFYIDLDTRLRKLETATAEALATANSKDAPKHVVDPAIEAQDYEAALNLFKTGKYKEAVTGFAAFIQQHPDSTLAPNAQFWLGNAWFAQRDCKKAIEAQNVVASRWPDSPKAPDALLAIATCQQELGNAAVARRTLETLVARYPHTPAAGSASQKLKGKK